MQPFIVLHPILVLMVAATGWFIGSVLLGLALWGFCTLLTWVSPTFAALVHGGCACGKHEAGCVQRHRKRFWRPASPRPISEWSGIDLHRQGPDERTLVRPMTSPPRLPRGSTHP